MKLKGLLSYLRVEEREAGTLRWLGGGHFEVTMKGLGGGAENGWPRHFLISRLLPLVPQGWDETFLPPVAPL